jgi:chorismate-pyruvate lyase
MEGFHPFRGIFVAQDQRPGHLEDVDLTRLSPFERALLVIDGTVTRFLEAHTLEPIDVQDCGQAKETLETDHVWLDLAGGHVVVSRRVLLRGSVTGRVHASAASLVVPDRVRQAIGHPVGRVPEGLGRLLLNSRVEQYRELLWYGRDRSADRPGQMRTGPADACLTRTYRIIIGGRPTMMITEWFPFDRIAP